MTSRRVRRSWPGLSLRNALLAALALGVIAPALLLLLLDGPLLGPLHQSGHAHLGDAELQRLLDVRRDALLELVLVQGLAGVAVLGGLLHFRLLRPIARLRQQASAIAARSGEPAPDWRGDDEIGQLGLHLQEVRAHLDGQFGDLERKIAQLRKMAMYDHLTGLPNRTLFRELFQHEAANARRHGHSMAVLFIDLDRFKHINDSMGHAVGDEVLLGTSQRLLQSLRESDLVCRHSGDEFLVLLRDGQRWETVAAAVERILGTIETPLPLTRGLLVGDRPASQANGSTAPPAAQAQVSASVGVALFPRDGDDFETLVRHADLAMYQAKQSGRARYSFYHAELNAETVTRAGLQRELAHAIETGGLLLHYQPVVDARSGLLKGAEALVRWQHPQRGLLMPSSFVGAAEESGLVQALGAWTLERACAQIAQWRAGGVQPVRIAVNVSAVQLQDESLLDTVATALQRHGVRPDLLEIELTESTLMRDDEATRRVVESLRGLGLSLVVDDFGTGYSSMSYLKRLRPDKLKIDRSFVQDLPDDADDRALTQAILGMARALDITVVAEGVETAAQRHFLADQGCALMQGALSGAAMGPQEFEQRLRERDQGLDSVPALQAL